MTAIRPIQTFLGVSLIEILICMFIFSLILFSFDVLEIIALRKAKSAYYFSVATQQLSNMLEQFQTFNNQYSNQQLFFWNQQNQSVLPHGRGTIANGYITISWGEKVDTNCLHPQIGLSGCLRQSIKPV